MCPALTRTKTGYEDDDGGGGGGMEERSAANVIVTPESDKYLDQTFVFPCFTSEDQDPRHPL